MHTCLRLGLICASILVVALGLPARTSAQAGGFQIQNQFITGLNSPTAMAFAPDGRLFVTQQAGSIRVVTAAGQLLATPFLTLPSVRSDEERGLLGIAFDPQFTTNGWVYIFYSPGNAAVSRVSRVTASGNLAVASSEVTIFEYGNFSGNHRGGDIHFGPDGMLYIALGDAGEPTNSQSVTSFDGKILRLNKNGTAAAGNPATFTNSSGATLTPSGLFRAIWAIGLRNPYRFSFSSTGSMRINDVGAGAWEEVNVGVAGSNYGWPTCEGICSNAFARNPIYVHVRGPDPDQGCAITGGAFESGTQFPATYDDTYFLIDYCSTWLRHLRTDNVQATLPLVIPQFSVDLKFAPDGSLYILGHGAGTIARVTYTGTAQNRNPVAQGTATPTSGPAPLTVAFSAAGSSDLDGDPLTFAWAFGDGATAGGITTSHTYPTGGTFAASVTVSDGRGGTSVKPFTIAVGRPPTPTISQPVLGSLYSAGDTIAFAGTATDPDDGTLPASAFSWTVLFHHDIHTHPALGPLTNTRSGSFTIPRTGHTEDTVFYRIYLTVTDASGLQTLVTRDVVPRKAQITLATSVTGAQVLLDGQPQVTPYTFTGVVGVQRTLDVPSPQTVGGRTYTFSSWSDGGARSHVITTPATNQTYTAALTALNRNPVAQGTATPTSGPAPLTVAFSAAGSSDPDGDPLTFTWAFGDGTTAGGITTSHTYPTGGTFAASVTVSDGRGGTSVRPFTIAVGAPPAPQITLATSVTGAQVLLDGQPRVTPYTFTGVVGVQRTLDVPSPQTVGGRTYRFSSWSDGGARSHVITTPATNQTYTAALTVTTTPPDSRPQALASVVARTAVTLTWAPPPFSAEPVTGYLIEAGLAPGATLGTLPVGDVLTFVTSAPSGRYFLRVRALTAGGQSAPSDEIVVALGQAAPPLAPLGLLATVQGTTVAFQWRENPLGTEITQYQLHAGTGPGLSDLGVLPLAAGATTLATSAPAGTYYVRAAAANAAGAGPASNEATVTLGPGICTIPAVPTGLTAVPQAGGVTLRWNAPAAGAIPTRYRLEAGATPGTSGIGTLVLPVSTVLAGPVPSGTYFLRLAATNSCGSSAVSTDITFVIP